MGRRKKLIVYLGVEIRNYFFILTSSIQKLTVNQRCFVISHSILFSTHEKRWRQEWQIRATHFTTRVDSIARAKAAVVVPPSPLKKGMYVHSLVRWGFHSASTVSQRSNTAAAPARRIVAGSQQVACTRQSRGAHSAKAESPFTPLYRDRGARYRSQLQRAQGPHS